MSAVRVRRYLVGCVLGAVLLLTGCTDVTQDRPVPIEPGDVPFGLLDRPDDGTAATSSTTLAPAPTAGAPSAGAGAP